MREWCRSNSLSFGGLLETRVKEGRAAKVAAAAFRDWSMVSNYEFNPLGRIWVVWSNQVKVNVVLKSAQMICCLIRVGDVTEDFLCSFIYAYNYADQRRKLWTDITHLSNMVQFKRKPWICFGDFNEILDIEEHSAGHGPVPWM